MKKRVMINLVVAAFFVLTGCGPAIDIAFLAVDFAGSGASGKADIQVIAKKEGVVLKKGTKTLVVLKTPPLNTVDKQKQINYIKAALDKNQVNYTLADRSRSIYQMNVDIEVLEAIKKDDGQHDLRVVVVVTLFKKNVVLSKIAADYKGKSSIWSEFDNMKIAGGVFDQILVKMYAPANSSKAATVKKK